MKILVLDGNENQSVACVRSLARAGHRVFVGCDSSWSKAGWSRSCRGSFRYPSPKQDADAFVTRIAEEAARERGTFVLPTTERTTLPLSAARDTILATGGTLVLPSHETVLRAFDKSQTTQLARSLGITVPRTESIAERRRALELADEFVYPAVLKPASSEEFNGNRVRTAGAPMYATNAQEFLRGYEELSSRSKLVLVQEFVEGQGAGFFALTRQGELLAEFAHQRIRDVRPTGSGSALRVSVNPERRLKEAALAILRALKWHGVAMVEFRVRPDGEPVFMEMNGRFWSSLALAVYSGVDFPTRLARLAASELDGDGSSNQPAPLPEYRSGVRCRWLLGDFRHLLEVLGGAPRGYPGTYPSRWRAAVDFLTPKLGTFHDNFQIRDPMPEIGDWLDFASRRIPAAFRERRDATEKMNHVERRYSHS